MLRVTHNTLPSNLLQILINWLLQSEVRAHPLWRRSSFASPEPESCVVFYGYVSLDVGFCNLIEMLLMLNRVWDAANERNASTFHTYALPCLAFTLWYVHNTHVYQFIPIYSFIYFRLLLLEQIPSCRRLRRCLRCCCCCCCLMPLPMFIFLVFITRKSKR